jgi:hypothetical protein
VRPLNCISCDLIWQDVSDCELQKSAQLGWSCEFLERLLCSEVVEKAPIDLCHLHHIVAGAIRCTAEDHHEFESALRRWICEGLVGGEGFAPDANIIKADVQRHCVVRCTEKIDWENPQETTRPVREYLSALEAANPVPDLPKYVPLTDPVASFIVALK